MFLDQGAPLLKVHPVVLGDAELALLGRADHVFHQEAQQSPIVQTPLPGRHGFIEPAPVKPERQDAAERFLREKEDPARGQDALHFREDGLQVGELVKHLEGGDQTDRSIAEGEVHNVAGQAHRGSGQLPCVL